MLEVRIRCLPIILTILLVFSPLSALAQETPVPENMSPQQLDEMAQEAFDSGSAGEQAWASALWTRAAKLYVEEERSFQAAEAWDNAGRAHLALGETEKALTAFGAAMVQRRSQYRSWDAAQYPLSDVAQLADRSPVLTSSMGVAEEARFVNEVREIVATTPAGQAVASEIHSAQEATVALESLMLNSFTEMKIQSDIQGVPVYFRRWIYKDKDNALWNQVYADTTVSVHRVAYQIRYRVPGMQRDTTFVLPCANGCTQRVTSLR